MERRIVYAATLVAAVAWVPTSQAAKILEPTLPTIEFVMEPISIGLRYKITGSEKVDRLQVDSVNLDESLSLTSTASRENEVTVKEVVSGKVSAAASLAPTFSLKADASGSMERSTSRTLTVKDSEVRQRVYKTALAKSEALTRASSNEVKLEEASGYLAGGIRIVNRGLDVVRVEKVRVSIVGVDPGNPASYQTLASGVLGRESRLDGTIPGRFSTDAANAAAADDAAAAFAVDVEPALGGLVYQRPLLIEGLPNASTIDWLKSGLLLQARVTGFDLKVGGNQIRPVAERAKLLAKSAEIRVVAPDGFDRTAFVEADGRAGVFDALQTMGLNPAAAAEGGAERLVELLGRKSAFSTPARPPALYDAKMSEGAWVVAGVGPTPPDLRSPLLAGQRISVVFLTNLDLARASPPSEVMKAGFEVDCALERAKTGEVTFPAPPPGALVNFSVAAWQAFASTHEVPAASHFKRNDKYRFEDSRFYEWMKAVTVVLDPAEAPLVPTESIDDLGLELLVGPDRRPASFSRVVGGGRNAYRLDPDGTARFSFTMIDGLASGADLVVRASAKSKPVEIGRKVNPPAPPPGKRACVGDGCVDWPRLWASKAPISKIAFYPARRFAVALEVIHPVVVDPTTDRLRRNESPPLLTLIKAISDIKVTLPPLGLLRAIDSPEPTYGPSGSVLELAQRPNAPRYLATSDRHCLWQGP